MKLSYKSHKDESRIILTNFNCGPSQELLRDKDLYKILWIQKGSRTVHIDGYEITLDQNQVIFCTPLNVLEISQEEGLIALVFNREFYCIRDHDAEVSCYGFLFFGSSKPPVIQLENKDLRSFQAMFYILQEEFETRDHIQGEMLRVLLKRLLIVSSRLTKEKLPEPEMPQNQLDIVRQYHILVEQHFREKHSVAAYASLLFKSPKTLSNLFKKTSEKSPLQIINERIMLEAKRLLLYSDKNIEEVGYELGFNDPSHFSKFFKKHESVPPVTFKKQKSSQ